MPDVIVGVQFVKQETLFYCGPATLEMLLRTLGVASPATPPTWQDQLWVKVQASTGAVRPSGAPSTPTSPAYPTQKCEWCAGSWKCWSTTPGVLEKLVNAEQNAANYSITLHGTEESATATLLDTLDAKLPGAALVRGWQHWLAVDGYRHGGTGFVSVAGRNLNGVFLRDPWEDPTVHYVTWSDWKGDYLRFVPCGDYKSKYVVMGGVKKKKRTDPPPPPPNKPQGLRIIDPLGPEKLRLRMVKKIIPNAEAIKRAREAAAELADSARLRPGLASGAASKALLVQRLDDRDRYYYIVSWTSGGRETARMIIDAHDGHYSEVAAIEKTGQFLPPYRTGRRFAEWLLKSAERLSPEMRYEIRKGVVGEHPIPVWKPCGQSSSPFMPFYQYSIGDTFVYVRFDGQRFDELTEGPA